MSYYLLDVYVPESHLEAVRNAVFEAGAGRIGNYDQCCWQTLGEGHFRPLAGANPHIGKINVPETVREWKIELICAEEFLENVIAAVHAAHPYETPSFQYWEVKTK